MTTRSRRHPIGAFVLLSALGCGDTLYRDPTAPPPGSPVTAELTLSPGSASFSGTEGGSNPAAQRVQVRTTTGTAVSGLRASVTYQGATGWLSATLDGSVTPTSLTVQPRLAGLPPGSYYW